MIMTEMELKELLEELLDEKKTTLEVFKIIVNDFDNSLAKAGIDSGRLVHYYLTNLVEAVILWKTDSEDYQSDLWEWVIKNACRRIYKYAYMENPDVPVQVDKLSIINRICKSGSGISQDMINRVGIDKIYKTITRCADENLCFTDLTSSAYYQFSEDEKKAIIDGRLKKDASICASGKSTNEDIKDLFKSEEVLVKELFLKEN
jgi:hypothetical protein